MFNITESRSYRFTGFFSLYLLLALCCAIDGLHYNGVPVADVFHPSPVHGALQSAVHPVAIR